MSVKRIRAIVWLLEEGKFADRCRAENPYAARKLSQFTFG